MNLSGVHNEENSRKHELAGSERFAFIYLFRPHEQRLQWRKGLLVLGGVGLDPSNIAVMNVEIEPKRVQILARERLLESREKWESVIKNRSER